MTFVLELIYQRRDGATRILADLLVKNVGDAPISQLRLALPYSLLDLREVQISAHPKKAERVFELLQHEQLEKLRLRTLQLLKPLHESNWPYRTLQHVTIDQHESRDGVCTIIRRGQVRGGERLKGYIKRNWAIAMPPESDIDRWTWFLYAVNEIMLVDVSPTFATGD